MHVGRYLNFYEPVTEPHEVAPGWDEWRTITGGSDYFDYEFEVNGKHGPLRQSDTTTTSTRVINARASQLIESFAPEPEPFFLQIDHIAPHQASGERTVGCKSSPIPDPRDRRSLPRAPSRRGARLQRGRRRPTSRRSSASCRRSTRRQLRRITRR